MISFLQCIIFERISYSEWPLETGWDLEHIVNSHETEGHQNDAMPGYSQETRLKQVYVVVLTCAWVCT